MAYTTINKSTDYFNTLIYSGTGGNGTTTTQAITGAGFQPDWVWLKQRTSTQNHQICDAIRGANNILISNGNNSAGADSQIINSFDSDGFTAGYQDQANDTGHTYVSWLWKAGTGAGSSNTDGSINTTSTTVSTVSGFSISQYTGTGSVATVGHGLGVVPDVVLVKRTDTTSDWRMQHSALGNTKQIFLNGTGAQDDDNTIWNDTSPTSSVFTVGTNTGSNASSGTYMAYCFASKIGFSHFGKYTGNGNASGPVVYTGMRPGWLMIKEASSAGEGWAIFDNKRSPSNLVQRSLQANITQAEENLSSKSVDFLSNGFKIRTTDGLQNSNGETYIYLCFAEAPLVGSNNVPSNAR